MATLKIVKLNIKRAPENKKYYVTPEQTYQLSIKI